MPDIIRKQSSVKTELFSHHYRVKMQTASQMSNATTVKCDKKLCEISMNCKMQITIVVLNLLL